MAKPTLPNPSEATAQGERKTIATDPRKDVIRRYPNWGGSFAGLADLPSPLSIADGPWNLSNELIWLMLRDPQVFAGYMLYKTGVLVDGVQIYPSKNIKDSNGKKSVLRQKYADEIAEFCLWNFNNIRNGFHSRMLQMLDCCVWGHKAGVQIYKDQPKGRWKNKLVLDRIRIMPNDSYHIRTDDFGNVVGLSNAVTSEEKPTVYPLSKFILGIFRPFDDHAWGSNILWPAYGAWYEKQQIAPERLANMSQFGSPSMYAEAPEGVKDVEMVGPDGMPMKYPNYQSDGITPHPYAGQTVRVAINTHMLDSLSNFQGNGSVTVIPNTAELHLLQAQGNGEVFRYYSDDKNLEIVKAMFFTTSWTEQEKYSSNAKGKVGASIGHFSLMDGKNMLSDLCEESLCHNLVLYNYGEEYLDLIPQVTFGNMEQGMMASLYNAIAALWSTGFFDETQRAFLCEKMNLPLPDPTAERPQQGQPTGNVLVNNNKKKDNKNNDDQEDDDDDE